MAATGAALVPAAACGYRDWLLAVGSTGFGAALGIVTVGRRGATCVFAALVLPAQLVIGKTLFVKLRALAVELCLGTLALRLKLGRPGVLLGGLRTL